MKKQLAQVTEFHEKHGFAVRESLIKREKSDETVLMAVNDMMIASESLDTPFLPDQRCSLILEEAAETILAIHDADMVALADGLADLIYVAIGTAVAYGIPIDRVFEEVHRSNMTKPVKRGDLHPPKGEGYMPPDIGGVLNWKEES